MEAKLKVNGFHTATTGRTEGIGSFLTAVDAAGVPFLAYCVDGTSSLIDAQNIIRRSSVPHNAIFRRSTFPHNQGGTDVPDYSRPAYAAALDQWNSHKEQWPKDLDPTIIWGETVNELRKEKEAAKWIGEFCYWTAEFALRDGRKWCGPGYSAGTPEEGSWKHFRAFLELCEKHPDQLGVALHEYSLEPDDIWYKSPGHIGRFQLLHEACDQMGIARPTIFMTEWGWGERDIPSSKEEAIKQIVEVGELYAPHANIKGCAIWALDGNWSSLANQTHALMEPLEKTLIETRYEVDGNGNGGEPPVKPGNQHIVNASFENGWTDKVYGNTKNHSPTGFDIEWLLPGSTYRGFDVTGVAEYRLLNQWNHLPPHERRGEENALVLDGDWTYKVFSHGAAFVAVIPQVLEGYDPGEKVKITWPINVHFDGRPVDHDPDDTLFELRANDKSVKVWIDHAADRQWLFPTIEVEADEDGDVALEGIASVMYPHPTAFFFDGITERVISAPPPKGEPREQYAREYWVAPQNASRERWLEIAADAFDGKKTIGFSYDDAGVGNLDRRTAVIYDLPEGKKPEFLAWYSRYYPGVKVVFENEKKPPVKPQFPIPQDRSDMPLTTDISKWQDRNQNGKPDDINFDVLRDQAKIKGVKIRTSDGKTVDPLYDDWLRSTRAAGLPHGNYHRLSMYYPVEQQFDTFVGARVLGQLGDWLDVETYGADIPTPGMVQEFEALYRAKFGTEIGIYTNFATWHYHIQLYDRDRKLWLANYENDPGSSNGPKAVPPPWQDQWMVDNSLFKFWQFAAVQLAGTGAPVDVNHFHGSEAEFDFLFPAPPRELPKLKTLYGLHARADGGDLSEGEMQEFYDLQPGVIKVLSSTSAKSVEALSRAHPTAEFIIRAFLDFGRRKVMPDMFVDWTIDDVERAVYAVNGNPIWVELHNEPNLRSEGYYDSWKTAGAFNDWYLEVLELYRLEELPVRFLFPGLSPGHAIGESVKADSLAFQGVCREAIEASDGLALHAYWAPQNKWPMEYTFDQLRKAINYFPNKPVYITEASNNKGGVTPGKKAEEYVKFLRAMENWRTVMGVTFFVGSASNPAWSWEDGRSAETWEPVNMARLVANGL